MLLDPTKIEGLTLEATIHFDESYGQLHDVLSRFLGFNEPSLHATCGLEGTYSWTMPPSILSFRLTGTFLDCKPNPPCDKLQLTSVGLSLIGYHTTGSERNQDMTYGYGIFGTMEIIVPQSPLPLELEFLIEEAGDEVYLEGSVYGAWEHAFGISGLTVS